MRKQFILYLAVNDEYIGTLTFNNKKAADEFVKHYKQLADNIPPHFRWTYNECTYESSKA